MEFIRYKTTALRSMSKDSLIDLIENLYREFDAINKALVCIKSDIELIEKGDAWHVHDNP